MQPNEEAHTEPRRLNCAVIEAKILQGSSFAAYLPAFYLSIRWFSPEITAGWCGVPSMILGQYCSLWFVICVIGAAISFAKPTCRGAGVRFLICGVAPMIIEIADQVYAGMGLYD